jgi:hypothetical protein
MKNFHSLTAVLSGLSNAAVSRLTWTRKISKSYRAVRPQEKYSVSVGVMTTPLSSTNIKLTMFSFVDNTSDFERFGSVDVDGGWFSKLPTSP